MSLGLRLIGGRRAAAGRVGLRRGAGRPSGFGQRRLADLADRLIRAALEADASGELEQTVTGWAVAHQTAVAADVKPGAGATKVVLLGRGSNDTERRTHRGCVLSF